MTAVYAGVGILQGWLFETGARGKILKFGGPNKIRLIPDKHHLPDVGTLDDGRCVWIDIQLNYDKEAKSTRDFVCTYFFNSDGRLISHQIEDLGLRSMPRAAAADVLKRQHSNLGRLTRNDIWVRPFSVHEHGLIFGLVVRKRPLVIFGESAVDAMPGMTLMFYPPWSEGEYDT